ncbi:MAG TPA: MFS transporter [Gemmata sp.]|jgi:nitrate/nitrite transporter NarK|nr:MFS transporter [Gemmata sp.]
MRYTVLSFLCIVTVIAYIQRSAFNGATKTIEDSLALGPSDMGFVMGAWYLAYAVFQLPSGWVADRIGSKRALLVFATSWSVLTGLVGLALGLPGLLLIWGLMGAAQAGIFPCCTKAIGANFPRTEQAFASGMLACCMSLGAALAPAITTQLLGAKFNLTSQTLTGLHNANVPETVLDKLQPIKDKELSQKDIESEIARLLNADETNEFQNLILNHAHLTLLTWQQIFALYAIPGVVWALTFTLFVPRPQAPTVQPQSSQKDDDADWHTLPPPTPAETPAPDDAVATPVQWSKLVTEPQMLLLCIQQFLRAGPMVLFFTWFARVLAETRGLSESTAGGLASWPPFVGAFGGVLGGLFSDWVLKRTGNARLARQGMTFAALVLGTTVSLTAFFVSDPHIAVLLMSIAAFCGMAGGVSGYSLAISYGGKRVATVFATMNMSGNLGASLFPIAVGWIVKETGNWNYVLLLFSGMFAGGAVCWAILNPKGTLFDEPREPQ